MTVPHLLSDDERWPRGDKDVLRCEVCPEGRRRMAFYRDGDKVVCKRHTRATTRISLELPVQLVDRLEDQAERTEVPRKELIETAITGLVREFEAIDADSERTSNA